MKQEYDIQSAYKYANVKEGSENSQVVQHVGHVPPVIEGVAVGLLSLLHLALVLQHVPQVPPGCHRTQQVALTGGGMKTPVGTAPSQRQRVSRCVSLPPSLSAQRRDQDKCCSCRRRDIWPLRRPLTGPQMAE